MGAERDPEDNDGKDHEEEGSRDGVEDGQGEVVDQDLGCLPRRIHDFLTPFLTYALTSTT
jgi:hypothetical protein